MSNIDKVRACHNLYIEFKEGKQGSTTKDLRQACCEECSLEYNIEVRDRMAKHDPTFQIAFRDGEIWDLQETIFQMWQRFETVGQVKPKSPKKLVPSKGKSKAKPKVLQVKPLNTLSGDINLNHFRALQGLQNKEHIKRLLRRVISKYISLESMYKEGEKLKKLT